MEVGGEALDIGMGAAKEYMICYLLLRIHYDTRESDHMVTECVFSFYE